MKFNKSTGIIHRILKTSVQKYSVSAVFGRSMHYESLEQEIVCVGLLVASYTALRWRVITEGYRPTKKD